MAGEEPPKELLFGRVDKKWWERIGKRIGKGKALTLAKRNLKNWEKRIRQLRKDLREKEEEERTESGSDSERSDSESESGMLEEGSFTGSSEESEMEDRTKSTQRAAKEVRFVDCGVVGKGEPRLKRIATGKEELKAWMRNKKK